MTTLSRSIEYLIPFIESHFLKTSEPFIIGVSGPQGSGKSYLSRALSDQLNKIYPKYLSVDLSTDDFYLSYEDQQILQTQSQPTNWIVSGRGPPGTHDLPLLNEIIDRIKHRDLNISIPRYDKSSHQGKGDRFDPSQWTKLSRPVDILIIEGWFNGYKALTVNKLLAKWQQINDPNLMTVVTPNDLTFVNESLSKYETIWDLFDSFIYLSTSNLKNVYQWRIEQEHVLKLSNGGVGMTDEQVVKFIDRYMPCYLLYYDELIEHGYLKKGQNLQLVIDKDRKLLETNIK